MVEDMKRIKWLNGEQTVAENATDLLEQLLHGWNPDTVPELKVVLAKRGNVSPPSNKESDDQFLQRLHQHGMFDYENDQDAE
jgi:hypothetical protein